MKSIISILLFSALVFGQQAAVSTSYQIGRHGESIGASISPEIITYNNRKVIFRLYGGYYLGNNWGYVSNIESHQRYEFGFESKNVMVTGKDFFNHIGLGYSIQKNSFDEDGDRRTANDEGWMFSFGFGTKLTSPLSVTAKYVWGPERGIRLVMEYDLF